jgi:hypothetical protein
MLKQVIRRWLHGETVSDPNSYPKKKFAFPGRCNIWNIREVIILAHNSLT